MPFVAAEAARDALLGGAAAIIAELPAELGVRAGDRTRGLHAGEVAASFTSAALAVADAILKSTMSSGRARNAVG